MNKQELLIGFVDIVTGLSGIFLIGIFFYIGIHIGSCVHKGYDGADRSGCYEVINNERIYE